MGLSRGFPKADRLGWVLQGQSPGKSASALKLTPLKQNLWGGETVAFPSLNNIEWLLLDFRVVASFGFSGPLIFEDNPA